MADETRTRSDGADEPTGRAVPPLAQEQIDAVRAAMTAKRIYSNQELARRSGVNRSYISEILHGHVGPGMQAATKLAAALGLPVSALSPTPDSDSSRAAPPDARDAGLPGPPWNTLGRVEDLLPPGAVELPVYKWGIAGDPLQFGQEDGPIPDHFRFPNPLKYSLISQHGFGVIVRGTSMEARGVHDGDLCWVNPRRGHQLGSVVAALVVNGNGDSGLVIKGLARDEKGEYLVSQPERGVRQRVECERFKVLGPVVTITREFPPE